MGEQAGPCLVQLLSPSNEYALAFRREEINVCIFEFAIQLAMSFCLAIWISRLAGAWHKALVLQPRCRMHYFISTTRRPHDSTPVAACCIYCLCCGVCVPFPTCFTPQVIAIKLNQVERVEEHAPVLAPVAQPVEHRQPVVITGHSLTIDQAGRCPQRRCGPRDEREAPGPAVPVAGEKPHARATNAVILISRFSPGSCRSSYPAACQ